MADETKPPTRMGKKELQKALLDLGYIQNDLLDSDGKQLKRPELLEKLQAHKQGEKGLTILSDIEEGEEIGVAVEQDAKDIIDDSGEPPGMESIDPPTPNDPEWTQYVLGKFLEDEVDGKNPRVEGLRRVAGELVGELIEEGCDLVAAPTEENRFRACAKAWSIFRTPEGIEKRFEALADAHSDNCHEDFATYLVAMADTRAKGRVYRNALCLRRVVAAEEVSKTLAPIADIQKGGSIHTGQISMIRLIAERNGFNIPEVLDSLGIEYEMNDQIGDANLQSLSYGDALTTAKKMREMKEEKEKK